MRTLILGGARSGKSALAERLAARSADVVYIATAQARDGEMAARVAHHRERRPAHWRTHEEPLALATALREHARDGRCVLVDCLTLWLSNLLGDERDPARYDIEREALLQTLPSLPGEIVLVSNEVGLGVVPMGELTRRFVDEAGRLHQTLGTRCERVLFVAAGLPLALKGDLP
ncbi:MULTISPECIES: bifunctional adenosylcobinamide kinase/adenosylcobinamide-phosphate guanylyltransferase [unclassified Lysobacter]|uniref:bifunctional adenosylcobinamide kinase/adenosylcobinamide-phosphate guanylyltransferase n=1 Tax=unclassified Lysobacter TaxID=2635362 RepID=UPI0006F4DA8D|nr:MULTISPECIES: bifunctional adenosylcobinamide kinase/adenosylcobinamide-phosphate guanylyltransferase [unclassified Lysobacter]KQZ66557.1 adenosylcobinamide kinase/adenosylcobinamide phosphate guanyltransferase [Lysobacter sp. Root559]KRC32709.1 adenosylcobinamide kinase/adenosylcobinamide phosphate guanyltransferase [Lysobacter sp. Root76]KRD67947.1 adenosylcobinamide kinase/adenosylcobinamide phosphate guanyltransferase [Lysobacter sp. Root96]